MLTPFALEGRLVRLEPLEAGHAQDLADAAAENRASYAFTWVPDGVADARSYADSALALQATGRALPFAVRRRSDGMIAGSTRFLDLDVFIWQPPPWPPGAGRGPVPADDLLTHAFEAWRVRRVTFKTDARNRASRGAIEHLGARFDGVLRAHSPAVDGTIRDTAYYSVLTSEWPAVRAGLASRLAGLGYR